MKTDFLIVGQGLAGSLLAWHLIESGQRVLVVDRDEEETSSKVAAGLVTPLAGGRFHLPPGLPERLDDARRFYWDLEERHGIGLFHHLRISRLFKDAGEAELWAKKTAMPDPDFDRFHGPLRSQSEQINAPFGGFEMRESGWLDLPAFLDLTRRMLLERASYAIGRVDSTEVLPSADEIRWKNVSASYVVFCEGWQARTNRFFDWIPMRPTSGAILDLEIPDLAEEDRILNRGAWLLPLGGGRFRCGSTYSGQSLPERELARAEILGKLARITGVPVRVTGQRQAFRPTIRRSQVFMGTHPTHARVAFFNGLGSKGVVNGPWHARALVRHLLHGEPLPPESDLSRQTF